MTPERKAEIARLQAEGLSIRKVAKVLGIPPGTVALHWKKKQAAESKWTEEGDKARVEFTSDRPVKTLDDAIEFSGMDRTKWYVERWECTSWETVTKDDKKEAHKHHLWRVWLDIRLILPRPLLEAAEAIYERIGEKAPPPVKRIAWKPKKILCAVALNDAHFGNLCWAAETGHDYDLKIAEQIYKNAIEDLLGLSGEHRPEKFLITIGNDFFHVDNHARQTTAGTPQDTDGRLAKIVESGERALFHGLREMASRAPVEVLWIPGNHDRLMSYMLTRIIAAEFRRDDRVTVDAGPNTRKYCRYGTNFLGMIHGERIKPKDLPLLMARERPKDWAETTCREWHTGHLHTQNQHEFMGVKIRVLPSLSGTNAWHHESGYVGNARAAECLLYEHDSGLIGQFHAYARP
jgi:AcrR family transcriptional regulator